MSQPEMKPLEPSAAMKAAMEHKFEEPKVHFDGASLHTSWLEAHKARHGIKNGGSKKMKRPC